MISKPAQISAFVGTLLVYMPGLHSSDIEISGIVSKASAAQRGRGVASMSTTQSLITINWVCTYYSEQTGITDPAASYAYLNKQLAFATSSGSFLNTLTVLNAAFTGCAVVSMSLSGYTANYIRTTSPTRAPTKSGEYIVFTWQRKAANYIRSTITVTGFVFVVLGCMFAYFLVGCGFAVHHNSQLHVMWSFGNNDSTTDDGEGSEDDHATPSRFIRRKTISTPMPLSASQNSRLANSQWSKNSTNNSTSRANRSANSRIDFGVTSTHSNRFSPAPRSHDRDEETGDMDSYDKGDDNPVGDFGYNKYHDDVDDPLDYNDIDVGYQPLPPPKSSQMRPGLSGARDLEDGRFANPLRRKGASPAGRGGGLGRQGRGGGGLLNSLPSNLEPSSRSRDRETTMRNDAAEQGDPRDQLKTRRGMGVGLGKGMGPATTGRDDEAPKFEDIYKEMNSTFSDTMPPDMPMRRARRNNRAKVVRVNVLRKEDIL